MAIEITEYSGTEISIRDNVTLIETLIPKEKSTYEISDNFLVIKYFNFNDSNDRKILMVDYTQVGYPSVSNATELKEHLLYMGASRDPLRLSRQLLMS